MPHCLTLGMNAPQFHAETTLGNIRLSDFKGKWVVLFSHPGDFTPVCTTEFISFTKMNPLFVQCNAQLIGLSIDSNHSHLEWVRQIYELTGTVVPFPVIADRDGSIAKLYGMLSPDVSSTQTVRNVFIICPEQKIRAIMVYPMTVGRNISEILRTLIALQVTMENHVATPANWLPDDPVIVPPPNTFDDLVDRINDPSFDCNAWYLCFQEFYSNLPCQVRSLSEVSEIEETTEFESDMEFGFDDEYDYK